VNWLDPSPWLVVAAPFLALTSYVTHRGLVKDEFRSPGKWGWFRYPRWSLDWISSTIINLVFLASFIFATYEALFHGTELSHSPDLPMPALGGELVETVHSSRDSAALAACLGDNGHGQSYALETGHYRVVARNGRGAVMTIYEISADGNGSRVEVWKLRFSVSLRSWKACLPIPA
jgi:hypothetical protein